MMRVWKVIGASVVAASMLSGCYGGKAEKRTANGTLVASVAPVASGTPVASGAPSAGGPSGGGTASATGHRSATPSPPDRPETAPSASVLAATPEGAASPSIAPANRGAPSASPAAYVADGEHAVAIRLDSEPRLLAPTRTVVANTPQSYTLTFREAMDRDSVERTILAQLAPGSADYAKAKLRFDWRSDRELRIVAETDVSGEYPLTQYKLDPNGSATASGKLLKDVASFGAVVMKPNQLWRASVDGAKLERISSFAEPYIFQALPNDGRYLLAKRFTRYCECDASYPFLYGVYDAEQDRLVQYPVELHTSYRGPGDLVVDTRGFFYARPEKGTDIPASETVVAIQVDAYIHGAGISRDRRYALLAAGREEQESDLDLIVYDLKERQAVTYKQALRGGVPESMVSSAKEPVVFMDDGKQAYTYMIRHEPYKEINYRYDWQSRQLTEWESPIRDSAWSGFLPSSDGLFRYYYNGGMYRGDRKLAGTDIQRPSLWIKGTHVFVSEEMGKSPGSASFDRLTVWRYDADREARQRVGSFAASNNASIVGGSADGQWIYISAMELAKAS